MLAFCVTKIFNLYLRIPSDVICVWIVPAAKKKSSPFFCAAKPRNPHRDIPSDVICVWIVPAAAEQSGDRQRREKGPPILTAEKGEHERAPRAGESYPTPLRATLRAPPSKWAIKAFFQAGERSKLSRREAWPQWGLGRSPKRPAGRVGGEQSDR